MKKIIIITISVLVIAGIGCGFYYYIANQPTGERITQKSQTFYVSGNAMIKKSHATSWDEIERDMQLSNGDTIRTAKDSAVEVKFGKGGNNIIAATDNTTIELEQITLSGDKKINLKEGQVLSLLEELDSDSTFEVKTPTAVCGVMGTGFEADAAGGITTVKVYEGQVRVKPAGIRGIIGGEVIVEEGNMTTIEKAKVPDKPRPLSDEDLHAWREWKGNLQAHQFRTFYVFLDEGSTLNHYTPSGWVGDYDAIRRVSSEDNPYSGKSCLKFRYTGRTPQGAGWGGVYWLNPVNNWGDVEGGFNLEGSMKLTFYARGEKGGEVIVRFGVGGVGGQFPDSSKSEIGPITLQREWRRYTIDLAEKDLSHMSGGFYWMTDKTSNPDGAIFYIDDIKYEE
ncbi:MAG: FecR domain-containing protein [Candidatus Omnitrophica bacterium]|nr:FecR domain-containing protein [Candidatus Omnitrophota bacterium]